jgi:hypothetical protein
MNWLLFILVISFLSISHSYIQSARSVSFKRALRTHLLALAGSGECKRLVIWDCDGVLVDSEALLKQGEVEALESLGFNLSVDDCVRLFSGVSPDTAAVLVNFIGFYFPTSKNLFGPVGKLLERVWKTTAGGLFQEANCRIYGSLSQEIISIDVRYSGWFAPSGRRNVCRLRFATSESLSLSGGGEDAAVLF